MSLLKKKSELELYCSTKSALIRVICRTNQWSGITEGDVQEWLFKNFKDIEGRYLATKILLHSLYYSEQNIIELLHYGIYELIIGKEIKEELITNRNIYKVKSETESEIRQRLDKVLFIPLLDKEKPSESGNYLTRILTHKLGIKNILFHFNIDSNKLSNYNKIIIIDDCIGSGDQIYNFWNRNIKIKELKEKFIGQEKSFHYLSLVGYENSILDRQSDGDLLGLRVAVCDRLNENNRIFSSNHVIWNSKEELSFAIDYFDNIEKNFGIPRLGFNDLDFAVFLHNSAPDWSLPIFWMEQNGWKSLVKRKNSFD